MEFNTKKFKKNILFFAIGATSLVIIFLLSLIFGSTNTLKEEDLGRIETEITLLLASIQDCVREKVKEKLQEREKDFER